MRQRKPDTEGPVAATGRYFITPRERVDPARLPDPIADRRCCVRYARLVDVRSEPLEAGAPPA